MKKLNSLMALGAALISFNALAATDVNVDLELRSMGLVCEVSQRWVWRNGGWTTEPYLTADQGYRYFEPKIELNGTQITFSTQAKFYYCSYGSGTQGVWVEKKHLDWQHFVLAPTEDFDKKATIASEYVLGSTDASGLQYVAKANFSVASVLSAADLADFNLGKSVYGEFYISVGNGDWNRLGGIYRVAFVADKSSAEVVTFDGFASN